jgi:N-acetylmuramoyl-L-alanine amidase
MSEIDLNQKADEAKTDVEDNVKETASEIKDEIKSVGDDAAKEVKDAAANVESAAKDAVEGAIGDVAGQVKGGLETLSQTKDQVKNLLQNKDVEGMLSGEISAVDKMKNAVASTALMGALSMKVDNKINISFSEPDEYGNIFPVIEGVEPDPAEENLENIINLITGMGEQDPADLKKFLSVGSPEGLKDTLDNVKGKIGGTARSASQIAATAQSFADNSISKLTADKTSSSPYQSTIKRIAGDSAGGTIAAGTADSYSIEPLTFGSTSLSKDEGFDLQIANKTAQVSDISTLLNVNEEASIKEKELSENLEELSDFKESQTLLNSLQNGSSENNELTARAEEYRKIISKRLSNNSPRGILEGLNIKLASTVIADIKKIAPEISDDDLNNVIDLSQGDIADFSDAIQLLSVNSSETYDVIYSTLRAVDTSITSVNAPLIPETVFSEPYKVGQPKADFSYISSVEELTGEFKVMEREVTEIIVHWTETYTNKNIGSEEIEEYQKSLGLESIGYHLVIRRDGSIQRGRPFSSEGEHTASRNKYTLGVVFVGGINAPSGTENPENFISVKSLTVSQFKSFDAICRAFYSKVPSGQIIGHNDIDDEEEDPGFDVIAYTAAKFLKGSVYKDPKTEGPYSISELNNKRSFS